jgi:hypothetical protein
VEEHDVSGVDVRDDASEVVGAGVRAEPVLRDPGGGRRCLTGPRYWASAGDLYQSWKSWKSWAQGEGAEELTQTRPPSDGALPTAGFIKSKSDTVRWTGIAVVTTDLEPKTM